MPLLFGLPECRKILCAPIIKDVGGTVTKASPHLLIPASPTVEIPASFNALPRHVSHHLYVGLSCLIVDDNAEFLKTAAGLLERQGLTVVGVASNSSEALTMARELQPDVTLVDIDLGEESGLDLAYRLTTTPATASTHVLLISAYAEMDYADLIAASPAVGFLSKSELSGRAVSEALAGVRNL
jgi:CheY-like chemotaxis protein